VCDVACVIVEILYVLWPCIPRNFNYIANNIQFLLLYMFCAYATFISSCCGDLYAMAFCEPRLTIILLGSYIICYDSSCSK
jgi:hypothetical protein